MSEPLRHAHSTATVTTVSLRSRPRRIAHYFSLLAPFLTFFVILLLTTIPRGLSSTVSAFEVPVMTWSTSAKAIFGESDAGSLLTAAISLRQHGGVNPDVFGVYNFWPPGMIWVDRVLLSLEDHLNIPIVLLMVVLNAAVWALFLGLCFTLLRAWHSALLALIFGAGALLYSGINAWGVKGGLFYSDSFGSIAYCLSLLLLVLVVRAESRARRITYGALSGLSLAVAAYFRATFEVLIDATLVFAAVALVIALIIRATRRIPRVTGRVMTFALPLTAVAIVAQLGLLPWRIFAATQIHVGDFRWTTVSSYASDARWVPSSVLAETPAASFLLSGHSNWACLDDSVECARIYTLEQTAAVPYSATGGGYFTPTQLDHLTIKSILAHPLNYLVERLDALSFGFASNTGGGIKDLAVPESIVLVILAIATIVAVIRARRFTHPGYLLFFFGAAIQFATIAVLHMEPRYFLAIELSIIVIAPIALLERRKPRADTLSENVVQDDELGVRLDTEPPQYA